MNSRREENALLDHALAHEEFLRESGSAIQIAAACVAVGMMLLACFFALSLGL